MFPFMDGFSGYSQIKMDSSGTKKTVFLTPMGKFHYTVMPFGLKNADVTYQHAMTTIFHDMLHGCLEDYVDDIIVKSKEVDQPFGDLTRVFARCRKYNLEMNPLNAHLEYPWENS